MEKKQNVPALRFQGFSGEWNTHTLESMCDVFTDGDWIEANDQSNVGIRLIQTGNIGVTEYTDKPKHKKWISKETFDRLHCTAVLPGDILISRLPEPAGRACVIPDLGMEMITAVDCTIARVAEAYSKEYLVQYLSTAKYFSEVRDCLAGGTRQRISRGNLSIFTIPVPADKTEQDKIGDFFEWLDNCIAVKKQKIQKLQQFRQAMLTKLFPREGAAEPELRFRGFSGKWVSKSFGKLFDMLPTNTLSRSDLNNKCGEIRDVHYGDILVKYNDLIDVKDKDLPFISRNIEVKMNALLKDGDIIIADTAEDMTVGKCVEMVNVGEEKVVSGLHTIACRPLESFAPGFLGYFFNSHLYHNQLIPLMQGIKVTSISKTALKSTVIYFPSEIEEQKRIGQFFMKLDSYISLQQKKLERMQRLKAALLEKLFV